MSEQFKRLEKHCSRRILPKGAAALAICVALLSFLDDEQHYADNIQRVHPTAPAFSGDNLRVLTANVHKWRGVGGSNNLKDLLKAMSDNDVDVACLQEVDIRRDQLQTLYERGYNVVYSETEREGFGNAVISRFDIELAETFRLPPSHTIRQRGALLVRLAAESGDVQLLATHVTTNRRYQASQFGKLGAIAHTYEADIACGDLNRELAAVAHSTLGEYFAVPIMDMGHPTYPARQPDRKIDYIFGHFPENEDPQLIGINSDHLGVLHSFQLRINN